MEKKEILKGMIEIYENDFMCGYEGEDKVKLQIIFLGLIKDVTKIANGYNYCGKKDCPCSPEYAIKNTMDNHKEIINEVLFKGDMALTDISPKTIRKFLEGFSVDQQ